MKSFPLLPLALATIAHGPLGAQPTKIPEAQEVQRIFQSELGAKEAGLSASLIDSRARSGEDDQQWRKVLGIDSSGKLVLDRGKCMMTASIHAPRYREELEKQYRFGFDALRQAEGKPAMLPASRKSIANAALRFDSFRQHYLSDLVATLEEPQTSFFSVAFMDEKARQLSVQRKHLKTLLIQAQSAFEAGRTDLLQVRQIQLVIDRIGDKLSIIHRDRSRATQRLLTKLGLPPDLELELQVPREWQAHIVSPPVSNEFAARIGRLVPNLQGNPGNKKQLEADLRTLERILKDLDKEYAAIMQMGGDVEAAVRQIESEQAPDHEAAVIQGLKADLKLLKGQIQTSKSQVSEMPASLKQLLSQLDEADSFEQVRKFELILQNVASIAQAATDFRARYAEVDDNRKLLLLTLPTVPWTTAELKKLGRTRNPWRGSKRDGIEVLGEQRQRIAHVDAVDRSIQLGCEEMERLAEQFSQRKTRLAKAFHQVKIASLEWSQPIAPAIGAAGLHPLTIQKSMAAIEELYAADLALTDALFRFHAAEFQLFGALRAFQFRDGRWDERATRRMLLE